MSTKWHENVGGVTHTHTHTHTQVISRNKLDRGVCAQKTYNILENIKLVIQ